MRTPALQRALQQSARVTLALAAISYVAVSRLRLLAAGSLAVICTLVGFHLLEEWERSRRISAVRRLRAR